MLAKYLIIIALVSCTEPRVLDSFPDEYVGVGLHIEEQAGHFHVLRVAPGSSAEARGLQSGDELVRVGERHVAGMSLGQIIHALRGTLGEAISVEVRRADRPIAVRLTRTRIRLQDGIYQRPSNDNAASDSM
jgi:carboxyl-terminal processing protease